MIILLELVLAEPLTNNLMAMFAKFVQSSMATLIEPFYRSKISIFSNSLYFVCS